MEGPNARAYLQGYVRYAGGATWHWAGICWRLTPEDMRLKSLYGVGRDWPFAHDVIEPYYTRAEYALGVCGPSDAALQWPPRRGGPSSPLLPLARWGLAAAAAVVVLGTAFLVFGKGPFSRRKLSA